MFCTNCGKDLGNDLNGKFCPDCGASIHYGVSVKEDNRKTIDEAILSDKEISTYSYILDKGIYFSLYKGLYKGIVLKGFIFSLPLSIILLLIFMILSGTFPKEYSNILLNIGLVSALCVLFIWPALFLLSAKINIRKTKQKINHIMTMI